MNPTGPVAAYIDAAFKSYVEGLVPPKKVEDYNNHLVLIFTDRQATVNPDGVTSTPAFSMVNFFLLLKERLIMILLMNLCMDLR